MKLSIIVLLCGLGAALVAFVISVSRGIKPDPVDTAPERAERAVRRSIFSHPRVARFLRARMDRKTAGGFLLTASFLILFAVALALGWLLDSVNDHSWLAHYDKSVAEWGSHNGRSETIDVLKWVTQLGSTFVVSAALLLTAVADYIRRHRAEVFAYVAAIGIGELIFNNVLKQIVSRQRPAVLHLVVANGYSFPSGHTSAAAAAWAAIALVLGRDRPKAVRAVLVSFAALIAVSVAASRALLGVHWLTDVIGGLALGWGWFMIVSIIFGGRAQRLGDPVAATAAGATATPADSAEQIDAGTEPPRVDHPVR